VATRPVSDPSRFAPTERPRIAIAADGSLAAIGEPTRIVIVALPAATGLAEIGTDPEATATELAWVGAPARLVVLSRYAAYSMVHLLDPYGPRSVAEIRLESPMRLFATVGPHALVVGAQGAAVLTAGESHLTPFQFPARAIPLAAGAAGGQFLVALPGAIEEWAPQTRMPKRRLRLPRPAVITALGGSERVVWMTTREEPARVDVIPLITRGQPKAHDLPEPIAHASGHPRSDLLVCIGAQSHKLYVVDLDGRRPLQVIAPPGIDRVEAAGLVIGRMIAALGAQAQRPLALIPLDDAPASAESPAPAPAAASAADATSPDEPPKQSTLIERDFLLPEPTPPRPAGPPAAASPAPLGFTPTGAAASPARQAVVGAPRGAAAPEGGADGAAGARQRAIAAARWRDDVVAWARAVFGGAEREPPAAPAVDTIAARFELAPPARRALLLLYGAHLCGEPGAAPVDVARVCEHSWDEALGRGALADARLAIYERSRVRLAAPILRALDELPPAAGALFGTPGPPALLAPWAAIAPGEPLHELAARLAAQIGGAILAARPGASPAELSLEARARGAVPLWRLAGAEDAPPDTEPAILVVDDEATAERLGAPLL
jgi:hypothetical protein